MLGVRFGLELVPASPVDKLVDLAVTSEELGFDTVWVTDHYNNRNVYVVLTAIALRTSKVMLGPGVTNPYVVSPVWTASAIATLDEISGGRAILGIGAGDRATLEKISVSWRKPLSAIRESVAAIRSLLRGEAVSMDGEFLKLKDVRLSYKAKRDVPIYIGAQAPRMLRLAATIGDGVLINASHPRDYEHALKTVKEAAGDRLGKLDVVAYTCFSVDREREAAREAAVPIVAFIAAGSPDMVLERHGIDKEKVARIREALSRGDFGTAFKSVTDEMLSAFSIYGTPEDCIEALEALVKLGVTHIVFGSPLGKKKKEALKLIADEIIKRFKE